MIITGLMSGTSADALDAALVEITDDVDGTLHLDLLAAHEVPFPDALTADIHRLLTPGEVPLELVSSVDRELGLHSAGAGAALLEASPDRTGRRCELVVTHGQTIRHEVVDGQVLSTLQIGQPAWIAERTGLPVLSDIRARDVAAGGSGAPLVSLLDHLLLAGRPGAAADRATAMLNLGGIANITVVAPGRETIAFDTGPANALIDVMARRLSGGAQRWDREGRLAAQGEVDQPLLEALLAEPYYARPAPKTTGKELFHGDHLDAALHRRATLPGPRPRDVDVVATVTALTARTVAQACRRHDVGEVVASGGGTRNPTLMRMLRAELTHGGALIELTTTDDAFGLPEGAKEACLTALLGWLSWHGLPGTLPSVTGAAHPSVAGRLTPGHDPLALPDPRGRMPDRLRIRRASEPAAAPTTTPAHQCPGGPECTP
ncbi:anhydro-N-acetylmuramic acid kinase [Nesterenkonia sp. HG001]|uniref:anhydro-N-acetylmuramic acid kinase n=1 Tax=Nesterenkonia sp. HG001 TaxID=2983207 RepID=UPI002AC5E537|nr:anhydro-N-acetylmuramic acid kinase [Nesterenkonia sp. HG001]MDZ5077995.1 anhydro-N-acetylmuramic acid kinase [Nesterenkonia sp. HG001]